MSRQSRLSTNVKDGNEVEQVAVILLCLLICEFACSLLAALCKGCRDTQLIKINIFESKRYIVREVYDKKM